MSTSEIFNRAACRCAAPITIVVAQLRDEQAYSAVLARAALASPSSAPDHEFERAVIRERTSAGLQAARERGKKGGRPKTLGPKELAAAKAMLADPEIRVEDVANHLKVSPATLYRHFPGGCSGLR